MIDRNGTFRVPRSAAPWRDLPDRSVPYASGDDRLVRWLRARESALEHRVAGQQGPRDRPALNFAGAVGNPQQAGVAVALLEPQLVG